MSEHVTDVTAATFESEVLNSDVPVVVDFWATWCGPCRQMAPALEQVAADLSGIVKVVKLDVDTAPEIAQSYGIRSVPTVIVFKGGLVAHSFTGARPASVIAREIGAAL